MGISIFIAIFASIAVGSASLVSFFLWRYLRHHDLIKSHVHSVGVMMRKVDEGNPALAQKNYITVAPQLLPAEAVDITGYIDSPHKENSFCLITGKAGVGKTSLTTLIMKEWSEKTKIPCIIFSLKQRVEGQRPEFDLPNFRLIDMSLHTIADINNNRFSFLSSFITALYSDLTNRGVMSHNIRTTLHDLVSDRTIKTWEELEVKVMSALKSNKNANFEQSTLNAILGDIRILKEEIRGEPLNIDWKNNKENLILDFGYLGEGELSVVITFWAEYYLRQLYKTRVKVYCSITESWRLLKTTDTVLTHILREGRVSWAGGVMDTQNYSDILPSQMQFATVFQHRTGNPEDYKVFRPFVADCVEQLRGRQFIDLTATHGGQTTIFELDIQGMYKEIGRLNDEKIAEQKEIDDNVYVPPVNDNMIIAESKAPVQVATHSIVSFAVPTPQKRDKEKLKEQIIELLKEGAYYQNEVCKKVGITDREDTDRTVVKNIMKTLVDNKIAKKEIYLNHKDKEIKYYFINEQRAESSLHRKGVDEIISIAESLEIEVQGHYISNQNWDVETSFCFIDFKRMATNFKDDIAKLQTSQKVVIFVCMNRGVEARYRDSLSMVEGLASSKYVICCLPELADILKRLGKSG